MGLKRKYLWIAIITLIGVLSLTACGARRAELSAPMNVVLDEREVLTWNAVENAVRYEVDVNGVSYRTEEESLDLFERIVQPGDYEIRVCAYGGKGELPSDRSEAVNYTLNSPQGLITFAEVDGGYAVAAVKPWKIKGKLVIPEAVGGVPVVQIYQRGFSECVNMTGLILPNTVSEIESSAFYGCTALKRVKLSEALECLEDNVFAKCSVLARVEIPEGVQTVGIGVFNGCKLLESVRFPSTLAEMANVAFSGCSILSDLTVAEGNPFFYSENNCVIRKSDQTLVLGGAKIEIPHGVKAIGSSAFLSRNGLDVLEIPEGVSSIGYHAFSTSTLTELVLPNSVTVIENEAFFSSGLKRIELPASLSELGRGIFYGCDHLTELTVAEENPIYYSNGNAVLRRSDHTLVAGCATGFIPEETTAIGNSAFAGFGTIMEIIVPANVKAIEAGAFSSCEFLSQITFPNGLESIGAYAFSGCGSLMSVVLPDSVEIIGKDAFERCTVYTSYPVDSEPEGWYFMEYSGGYRYGWNGYSVVFWGSTISYDGVYPYVGAYGEKLDSDSSKFGSIGGTNCSSRAYDNPAIPKRIGYTFAGWATEEGSTEVVYGVSIVSSEITGYPCDAAVSLTLKERLEIPYGTVLYAVWVPQS